MHTVCLRCKGNSPKIFCGRDFCPLIAKSKALFQIKESLKQDYSGASPSSFVGRFGYPFVSVGILTPPEVKDSSNYDNPRFWSKENYQIPLLITLRSSLVNSRFHSFIRPKNSKFLEISQEVSMASKPVDVEISLDSKPHLIKKFDPEVAPIGPAGQLKNVKVTSNPKIDSRVNKVTSDIDFKANDALQELYKKGFDENFLSKLLSTANIGVKAQRKLVPTRWAITAVDDSIGKMFLSQLHKTSSKAEYSSYFGSYLGNYYFILFFPEVWSYELFEIYLPKASWNISNSIDFATDYESYQGRKDYAENCSGGYYSVRMAIQEFLAKKNRQASCLVFRFITGEYAVPLGVWVTREAARKSLQSKPILFASKEQLLKHAEEFAKTQFNINITDILKRSKLLQSLKTQKKLSEF